MLSDFEIKQNEDDFLHTLSLIEREDADTDGLYKFLESTDFFTAPASTKYHANFKGGLCWHSLHVYLNLCKLADTFAPNKFSPDTLRIVALFHDLSKADYYKVEERNVNTGKKDFSGKTIWEKEPYYALRDSKQRLLMRDHEVNSYFLLSKYIKLTDEEAAAIMNHHGGWGLDSFKAGEISAIYEKYALAVLLHIADLLSVYVDERNE